MEILNVLFRVLLALVLAVLLLLIVLRIGRKLFRFPVPAVFGRVLDSDFRRRMYPPANVIKRSGILEGMKVLEVGCGSGAYTPFVARAVGRQGAVTALDIQAGMLKQLRSKLSKPDHQDLQNTALCQASAHQLPFADRSFDLAYMIAVLQEIPDRETALGEIMRVLKPGAILAVTEALTDPDYPLRSTTVGLGKRTGYMHVASEGNVWSYTVRFRRPSLNPQGYGRVSGRDPGSRDVARAQTKREAGAEER